MPDAVALNGQMDQFNRVERKGKKTQKAGRSTCHIEQALLPLLNKELRHFSQELGDDAKKELKARIRTTAPLSAVEIADF